MAASVREENIESFDIIVKPHLYFYYFLTIFFSPNETDNRLIKKTPYKKHPLYMDVTFDTEKDGGEKTRNRCKKISNKRGEYKKNVHKGTLQPQPSQITSSSEVWFPCLCTCPSSVQIRGSSGSSQISGCSCASSSSGTFAKSPEEGEKKTIISLLSQTQHTSWILCEREPLLTAFWFRTLSSPAAVNRGFLILF